MGGLTVFCHFHNEEFLLRYWLRHHRLLFDHGVLVDRGSTDRSVEIIRELAPDWEVVPSRNRIFDARDTDLEMMDLERRYGGWKMVLNATEFLFHHDPRAYLDDFERRNPRVMAIAVQTILMIDRFVDRDAPVTDEPLYFQRFNGTQKVGYLRLLHRAATGDYTAGRHGTGHSTVVDPVLRILNFAWSPYGQIRDRKLRIQQAIPESDVRQNFSWPHLVTPDELDALFLLQSRSAHDLRSDEGYRVTLDRLRMLRCSEERGGAARQDAQPIRLRQPTPVRRRVAVVTSEPLLGEASPGTSRASRIASALAEEHDVRILSTAVPRTARKGSRVRLLEKAGVNPLEAWADIVIADQAALTALPGLLYSRKPTVVVLADPSGLGLPGDSDTDESYRGVELQLLRGDLFLCATEAHREIWIEHLTAAARVVPHDRSMLDLLIVVAGKGHVPAALREFCRTPRRVTGGPVPDEPLAVSRVAYERRTLSYASLAGHVGPAMAPTAVRSRAGSGALRSVLRVLDSHWPAAGRAIRRGRVVLESSRRATRPPIDPPTS